MKSRAGVHAGLAAALSGTLPYHYETHTVLFNILCAVVLVLLLSAIILILRNQFTCSLWNRLVHICSYIDVGYTAAGFGLSGTGISLLRPGWFGLGIILLLIGALFIGINIGRNYLVLKNRPKR